MQNLQVNGLCHKLRIVGRGKFSIAQLAHVSKFGLSQLQTEALPTLLEIKTR